ncbi:MAG: hypothetical protein ABI347_00505 [Nitrososphaera sp.]|jgi:hypothetical protein
MMFFGKKKEVEATFYTEQICNSCGYRERRPFAQGDYVFMKGAPCEKCSSESTMISAIYGEYPAEKNNA